MKNILQRLPWKWSTLIFCTAFLVLSCSSEQQDKVDMQNSQEATSMETTESKDKGVKQQKQKTILFFGNSLTAGFGVEHQEAYPARIQQRIDSLNLPYIAVNAGVSGNTSADGLSRIEWVLEKEVDIFVLELGANDGLRGLDLQATRKNLQAIIDTVTNTYPDVQLILAGMKIPPNMGQEYTESFEAMFTELATQNNAALIPFLLDGVAGNPELNLPDGLHPTAEGYRIVTENVWQTLEPFLSSTS
jgi:acyl-CoA thioesterase-1